MTAPSDEEAKVRAIFVRSFIVGIVGVALATTYLIDASPNDSNIGFWLYTPTSMFFLWPYQLVLTLRLRAFGVPFTKYVGVVLTLLSIVMTIGIW